MSDHSQLTTVCSLKREVKVKVTKFCIGREELINVNKLLDLDLWPCDPKSIGFLISSFTTYMWSLKVIGQKL